MNKAKPYAEKGLKIAKSIGIGYLVFIGIILGLSIFGNLIGKGIVNGEYATTGNQSQKNLCNHLPPRRG